MHSATLPLARWFMFVFSSFIITTSPILIPLLLPVTHFWRAWRYERYWVVCDPSSFFWSAALFAFTSICIFELAWDDPAPEYFERDLSEWCKDDALDLWLGPQTRQDCLDQRFLILLKVNSFYLRFDSWAVHYLLPLYLVLTVRLQLETHPKKKPVPPSFFHGIGPACANL